MATRRPPKLDSLSNAILLKLKQEFIDKSRRSSDLQNGYIGPRLNDIEGEILQETGALKVDYDLSLKAIEDNNYAKTGPVVPYDNPPGSSVVVIAFFSKRDYVYLTESGYRLASTVMPAGSNRTQGRPTVHISGGTFNQSPIGVGQTVTQSLNFDVTDQSQSVNYLIDLLERTTGQASPPVRSDVTQMVQAASSGDMQSVKPIFQRLFGGVEETVKQLAYGVITAIITKQMGL